VHSRARGGGGGGLVRGEVGGGCGGGDAGGVFAGGGSGGAGGFGGGGAHCLGYGEGAWFVVGEFCCGGFVVESTGCSKGN